MRARWARIWQHSLWRHQAQEWRSVWGDMAGLERTVFAAVVLAISVFISAVIGAGAFLIYKGLRNFGASQLAALWIFNGVDLAVLVVLAVTLLKRPRP